MVNTLKIRDIHRQILSHIGKGTPIQFIIESTRLKEANFYKKLHTLDRYSYVKVKKVGKILTAELQPLGIKELSMASVGVQQVEYIRLHDVWVTCAILRRPPGWDTDFAERILEERSLAWTPHHPKNWKGLFFDYASVKVRITPNKVMFCPPNIDIPMGDDPDHAKNLLLKFLDDVRPRIENLFRISLGKPRKVSMVISSQHIGFVRSLFAKYFIDRDISLRIYGPDGRARVIADQSLGAENAELETVHKAYAEEDAEKLKDLISDVVTGEFQPRQVNQDLQQAGGLIREMAQHIGGVSRNQEALSKNQEDFGKNMLDYGQKIALHTQSIGSLGDGVDKLGAGVERLIGLVERMEKALERPKPKRRPGQQTLEDFHG